MQGRTFRGQSPDGTWHEGFLIRSPGVKNSRPGEGWYINSEQEPAYTHLVKPFTIGMSTGVKDMEGTMVFEGDIIKTTGPNERIFSVEFVSTLPMAWAISGSTQRLPARTHATAARAVFGRCSTLEKWLET